MSHSMPETTNTYSGNGHFINCTYQGTQNRRLTYHIAPFISSNTACNQQGFQHRRSHKSSNWFYSISSCKYSNNVFHTSNITARNLEKPPHARGTVNEGSLLSSMMIEQTIIQAVLSGRETIDGTKSKFEVWVESIENAVPISGQNTMHITLSTLTGSLLSTANRLKARSPNLIWMELKRESFMQYSVIPSDSHAT